MRNKLLLIIEEQFCAPIRLVANNELDLVQYLEREHNYTHIKVYDDSISFFSDLGNKETHPLKWVKEI